MAAFPRLLRQLLEDQSSLLAWAQDTLAAFRVDDDPSPVESPIDGSHGTSEHHQTETAGSESQRA